MDRRGAAGIDRIDTGINYIEIFIAITEE